MGHWQVSEALRRRHDTTSRPRRRPTHPSADAPLLELADRGGNRGLLALARRSASLPLDARLRTRAERTLDAPLPDVRVHDDAAAADAARRVGARAFTVGRDIYLGGAVATGAAREETLGHELAHVLQHAGPARGGGADPESEARAAGRALVAGGRHAVGRMPSAPVVQLDAESDRLRRWEELVRTAGGTSLSTSEVVGPMRDVYNAANAAIQQQARAMVEAGAEPEVAMRWLVAERNALKLRVRSGGPTPMRWWAELRNRFKYGNPVGPSADSLLAKELARGAPDTAAAAERVLAKGTSPEFNAVPRNARMAGGLLALPVALLEIWRDVREGLSPGHTAARTAGALGNFFAFPGMYGGTSPVLGMKPGRWGGGAVDFGVNLLNAVLQLAGAPKPLTSVTQTAADLTPSSTMAAGTQSAIDFAWAGITEGTPGLERVHQQQLAGGGGGVLQGYAMLGGLAGGEDLDMLTSPEAREGKYGIFVESGNFWGDVFAGEEDLGQDLRDLWDWL